MVMVAPLITLSLLLMFLMQAEEFPALGPAPARAASGALSTDGLKQQPDVSVYNSRSLFTRSQSAQ